MDIVDNSQWIEEQLGACDLKHKIRAKRLVVIASHMLEHPEASLPQQNPQWKDLKAAYRLFDRPEVTYEAICEPHWKQTRKTASGRYVLISDTTDINHYSHQATEGLGILGDGKGRGVQLHSCLMYDCRQAQIHGQAGGTLFYRSRASKKEPRSTRMERVREGIYWGQVVQQVGPPPEGCQWIHVFDRAGDNFEALCYLVQNRCDWVIRCAQLHRNVLNSKKQSVKLSDVVDQAEHLGSYELSLRCRPGIAARTAKLDVYASKVTFIPPAFISPYIKSSGIDEIEQWVVLVQEAQSPKGVTPIRWVLLTSQSVENLNSAWQVIADYELRWLIEEYHKVLKSACGIEQHALRTTARLEPLIGLTSIIGIRLLSLKLLGREDNAQLAQKHVPTLWLKALSLLKPKLNIAHLSVYEFFRELGKLGGFLGRTADGEPGWQTIWRGYQKLHATLDTLYRLERTNFKKRG